MTDELNLYGLSDKVDISEDGLLQHNLNVLKTMISIGATVSLHFEVELRTQTGLYDPSFAIRGEDGVWVAFTYEEAIEFLAEIINEKSREAGYGEKN